MAAKKKEKKKTKKWVLRPLAISALKKLFVRSPMFQLVKKKNRRQYKAINKDGSESNALRWEYQCSQCNQWFPEKIKGKVQIQVDHINPVVDTETGWVDYNTWIEREFIWMEVCDLDNETEEQVYEKVKEFLSLKCLACHSEKSSKENARRREVKKLAKPIPNPDTTTGNKNRRN